MILKTKKCIKCNVDKLIKDFPLHSKKVDRMYYNNCCNLCRAVQAKKRIVHNKKEITKIKRTLCCAHCGISDYRVLDFHHINRSEKRDSVSALIFRGVEIKAILKEIDKCICLCGNCHRIVHHKELYNE